MPSPPAACQGPRVFPGRLEAKNIKRVEGIWKGPVCEQRGTLLSLCCSQDMAGFCWGLYRAASSSGICCEEPQPPSFCILLYRCAHSWTSPERDLGCTHPAMKFSTYGP